MGKRVSKSGLAWPMEGRQSRPGADRGAAALQRMKTLPRWVVTTTEATGTEVPASLLREELGGWVRKRKETQDGSTEQRTQRI